MKYYKRGFLNKKEGMAAFEADTSFHSSDYSSSVEASFCITDCNRKVSLDFCIWDKDDAENAFFKLSTLITELIEFEKNLKEQAAVHFEFKAKKEQKNET